MPKPKPKQLDMFGDGSFRSEVLPLFEEYRGDWLAQARAVARHLGADRDITIDDVRMACPPPDNVDPRVMGAVFHGGEWRLIDHVSSIRSTCHKRPIGLFRHSSREKLNGQT